MSVDIRETLRDAAQGPQHPIDVRVVHRRGRRRRLARAAATVAVVVVVMGAAVLGARQLVGTRTAPTVGEGPQSERSDRVVVQLGAPGGVPVFVVESTEGTCVWFGPDADQGASCGLDANDGAVAGAAVVLPDGSDGHGVIAGRLPDAVTSVTLDRDADTTPAQIVDTGAGRFFIATGLEIGEHLLTASTSDGTEYVSGAVEVRRNATSGVFLAPMPSVTGSPVVSLAGTRPQPWRVQVAPGQDDRWCAITSLADQPTREPKGCDQLIGPAGVPRETGFGSVSTSTRPDGTGLAWGTVTSDATEVIAVFPDGTRRLAEFASGPMPFDVWAIAYTERPDRFEALDADGSTLGAMPLR